MIAVSDFLSLFQQWMKQWQCCCCCSKCNCDAKECMRIKCPPKAAMLVICDVSHCLFGQHHSICLLCVMIQPIFWAPSLVDKVTALVMEGAKTQTAKFANSVFIETCLTMICSETVNCVVVHHPLGMAG